MYPKQITYCLDKDEDFLKQMEALEELKEMVENKIFRLYNTISILKSEILKNTKSCDLPKKF